MNEDELTQRPRRRRGTDPQQPAFPEPESAPAPEPIDAPAEPLIEPAGEIIAPEPGVTPEPEPIETVAEPLLESTAGIVAPEPEAESAWQPGSSIVAPYEPIAESEPAGVAGVEPVEGEAVAEATLTDDAETAVTPDDLLPADEPATDEIPSAEEHPASILDAESLAAFEAPAEIDDGTVVGESTSAELTGETGADEVPMAVEGGEPGPIEEPAPRRRERRPGDFLEAAAAQQAAMTPAPLETPSPTPAPAPPKKGKKQEHRRAGTPRQVDFASVQVDRDDDLSTVFGKLHTATSARVALVAHGGSRELEQSKLSLRRLKRYSEQTGKDMVLVSRRWNLRAKARREGLRTAYMTRGIRWGRRRRVGVSIPGLGGLTRLVIGLGVIFAALLGAYLVIPSATIKIRPSIQPISKPVEATVSLDVEEPDFELGELPAERLTVNVDFKIAVPVTGTADVPTGKATGVVVFTNPKDEIVTIPAETRVKTADATVFVTDEEIDVPAGGEQDVEVTALVEGASGAVPADSLTILEGDLVGEVTVTNPQPTDPEGTENVPAVVEDDLANLRTVAVEQVTDTAMEELRKAHPGDLIFEDTLLVQIVNEEFSAGLGEPANWVTIDAELAVTAIAASSDDLREMAKFWLAEDLTEDEVLLDRTLTAELAPDTKVAWDEEAGIVGAEILLQGGVIPYFDPAELKGDLAGSNVDDARAFLGEIFPSLTEPSVDRGPGWLPGGIPRFDWRIQLIVEPGP